MPLSNFLLPKRFRESTDSFYRGLSLGLFAGFIGLLFHAVGSNTFIIIRIMEPFWFLTAMVLGAEKNG